MHDIIALVCHCSCMSCEKRKVATAVVEVVDQADVCLYVRIYAKTGLALSEVATDPYISKLKFIILSFPNH